MYQLIQLADDLNRQRQAQHAQQHPAQRAHSPGQATRHARHARQLMLRAVRTARRLRTQPHAQTSYVQ
jgi:hypothetical protein